MFESFVVWHKNFGFGVELRPCSFGWCLIQFDNYYFSFPVRESELTLCYSTWDESLWRFEVIGV